MVFTCQTHKGLMRSPQHTACGELPIPPCTKGLPGAACLNGSEGSSRAPNQHPAWELTESRMHRMRHRRGRRNGTLLNLLQHMAKSTRAGSVLRARARFALCFLPGEHNQEHGSRRGVPHPVCDTPGLSPCPVPPAPQGCLCGCAWSPTPHTTPRADTCVHTQPPRAGLKGSLFPRVIIPERGNRNVLKTPRWTFLTGAGASGHTVAPLFPPACLEQAAHTSCTPPPFPEITSPWLKTASFPLIASILGKTPQASPCPGLAGRCCSNKGSAHG